MLQRFKLIKNKLICHQLLSVGAMLLLHCRHVCVRLLNMRETVREVRFVFQLLPSSAARKPCASQLWPLALRMKSVIRSAQVNLCSQTHLWGNQTREECALSQFVDTHIPHFSSFNFRQLICMVHAHF